MSKPKQVRISISPEIHLSLKIAAVTAGVTINRWIDDAIKAKLERGAKC